MVKRMENLGRESLTASDERVLALVLYCTCSNARVGKAIENLLRTKENCRTKNDSEAIQCFGSIHTFVGCETWSLQRTEMRTG